MSVSLQHPLTTTLGWRRWWTGHLAGRCLTWAGQRCVWDDRWMCFVQKILLFSESTRNLRDPGLHMWVSFMRRYLRCAQRAGHWQTKHSSKLAQKGTETRRKHLSWCLRAVQLPLSFVPSFCHFPCFSYETDLLSLHFYILGTSIAFIHTTSVQIIIFWLKTGDAAVANSSFSLTSLWRPDRPSSWSRGGTKKKRDWELRSELPAASSAPHCSAPPSHLSGGCSYGAARCRPGLGAGFGDECWLAHSTDWKKKKMMTWLRDGTSVVLVGGQLIV